MDIKNLVEDQGKEAAAGEKHQTKHEEPEAKRLKTEKQTEITPHLESNKKSEDDKVKEEEEPGAEPESPSKQDAGKSAVKPSEEPEVPSSILEKGIIYFFIRGRVNTDHPSGVADIQRTFLMLRPIPHDAKLGKGPIGDAGNTRLVAVPKKVLPASGRDRFMAFVEKSEASFEEIKGQFLEGEEYTTKTVGTRHTPAATPVGEGVYALTTTGRESHLAYMMTLPEELGEVQEELGLKRQGSFILSTKNPQYEGPAYASLPQGPAYPEKILESFRALRWLPTRPEHLDYVNAQILLIGHSSGLEALKGEDKKGKGEAEEEEKEEPVEALESLEEEDLARMRALGESAAIFADLTARAEDYPNLQTTF